VHNNIHFVLFLTQSYHQDSDCLEGNESHSLFFFFFVLLELDSPTSFQHVEESTSL